MIKVLSKHYDLVGLRPQRRLRVTQHSKKALWIFEWIMEKLYLVLKGIRLSIQNNIDLLFCEEPEYALVGLILSRIFRKPIIYDSHSNKYLQCKRFNAPFYYTLYITILDIISARLSTLLLVVSEFEKKIYISQGIPSNKIRVLPSFIDLREVDRAKEGSSKYSSLFKGKRVLLFFGNLGYQPNIEALQFINNELAPALEDIKEVEIYVCGKTPVSDIQYLVKGKLHSKVKYLGFVPNIYEILHAIDIFICPLWKTAGIIVKVLDAMAVGKPIVATRFIQEGIPELKEYNTFLATSRSQYIYLVRYLIKHYDKYKYIGLNLRRIIITKYSLDVIEKQLSSIIHSIVNERRVAARRTA